MQAETVYVEEHQVACEGNSLSLGHPRIFMSLEKMPQVICPYCSRLFKLKEK